MVVNTLFWKCLISIVTISKRSSCILNINTNNEITSNETPTMKMPLRHCMWKTPHCENLDSKSKTAPNRQTYNGECVYIAYLTGKRHFHQYFIEVWKELYAWHKNQQGMNSIKIYWIHIIKYPKCIPSDASFFKVQNMINNLLHRKMDIKSLN